MSGWNYRIVRKKVRKNSDGSPYDGPELFQFGIHEAYCDDNGWARAITEDAVDVVAFKEWATGADDTPESMIKQMLERMLSACSKPILDFDDIPENDAISPLDE